MKIIQRLIFFSLFFTSCQTGEKLTFNGDTVTVDYPKQIDHLKGNAVTLEGEYTGGMYAYDGMLVFDPTPFEHPEGTLLLYDLATGKRINAICPIGEGPNEYLSVSFEGGFVKDSGQIYLWVSNGYKNRIELLNTQGEIVKSVNTSKFKSTNSFGIGSFYVFNDSLFLSHVSSIEFFPNKFSAPSDHLFNYQREETIKEYTFYSDFSASETSGFHYKDRYLSGIGGRDMNPDKSKLATVMPFLKQVDILDFKTGKMKAVRTPDAPDLNRILTDEPIQMHYRAVDCDERYIYVVEGDIKRITGNINVFDWEGNFVRVLRFNERGDVVFTIDPIRKKLYIKTDDEQITAYDLNYLYQ